MPRYSTLQLADAQLERGEQVAAIQHHMLLKAEEGDVSYFRGMSLSLFLLTLYNWYLTITYSQDAAQGDLSLTRETLFWSTIAPYAMVIFFERGLSYYYHDTTHTGIPSIMPAEVNTNDINAGVRFLAAQKTKAINLELPHKILPHVVPYTHRMLATLAQRQWLSLDKLRVFNNTYLRLSFYQALVDCYLHYQMNENIMETIRRELEPICSFMLNWLCDLPNMEMRQAQLTDDRVHVALPFFELRKRQADSPIDPIATVKHRFGRHGANPLQWPMLTHTASTLTYLLPFARDQDTVFEQVKKARADHRLPDMPQRFR